MLCFGIDAGGTKTELLARDGDDGAATQHQGPAANLQRAGVDGAADVLERVIRDAMVAHGGAMPEHVCAGVAGAGRAEEQTALGDALRHRFVGARLSVEVVHDGEIAFEGAFGEGSGLIAVAGTGSVLRGRTRDGRSVGAGGWGYLLGDEGSGYAIGRAALHVLTAAFDAGRWSPLATRLRDALDVPDAATLIRRVYREGWPVQRAAPLVCAAAADGDADANALLATQAAAFSIQAAALLAREGADAFDPRLAFIGGVSREAVYRAHLTAAFARALPGWTCAPAERSPCEGAWSRAHRMAMDAEA